MIRRARSALALLVPVMLLAWAGQPSDPARRPPAPVAQAAALATIGDWRHAPVVLGEALADETPARLAFSLRVADQAGVDKLLRDQQDPTSPSYHAWLTPAQYGERFGLPAATYARVVSWLEGEGFAVTSYPNRLFVEATGTVRNVRDLVGVQPRAATQGTRAFRAHVETPTLPADIAPLVVKIGGLDTRSHLRRRLDVGTGKNEAQVLGAEDIRLLYDMPSAASTTTAAAGLTLVVLATQEGTQASANGTPGAPFIEPSAEAIQTYFATISKATATYKPVVLPNPNASFDAAGFNQEYELDVEMQSVGAPNAKEIDMVLAPSSDVFMGGANYVVNMLPSAITVSTSIGECESEEIDEDGGGAATVGSEAYVLRQAVQQGLAEGQTWFAAAGDSGADDCDDTSSGKGNGFGGGNATVDFPCSLPEIVCMGGTQFQSDDAGAWTTAGALAAPQAEVVWNEGSQGGAGGGGQSMLYAKPSWQEGVGPKASDNARDVPDISLTAGPDGPGVAVYECGAGQDQWTCKGELVDAGTIDIIGGTSVAAPLGAGMFARLAAQTGCRLGDVHPNLYALGAAQLDGGASPFHDITSGNNDYDDQVAITGYAAGPGYDLASGWGTIDFEKLVAAWPACDGGAPISAEDDGGGANAEDAGTVVVGSSSGATTAPSSTDGGSNGATASASASSGCGCTTAGAPAGGALCGLASLGALGFVVARRRRRSVRTRSLR